MSFTTHEYTKMYECDAQETIVAYPARLTIQMIVCYFHSDGDQIKLTDAISGHADETTDATIIHLRGDGAGSTQIINWSDKPRHFYGLKVATISSTSCKAFVYLA